MNTPAEAQKQIEFSPTKGQVAIVAALLFAPFTLPGFARWIYFSLFPLTPTAPTPTWFETSGQFGDMFGISTCMAALIAAYYARRTYLTQKQELQDERIRTEKADRERHFFKLQEDLKASLDIVRQKGSPMSGSQTEVEELFNKMKDVFTEMGTDPYFNQDENHDEKCRVFCKYADNSQFIGGNNFTDVVLKFDIATKYLDKMKADYDDSTYEYYYKSLMVTLREKEVKVLCFMMAELEQKRTKADAEAFVYPSRIIDMYVNAVMGINASRGIALMSIINSHSLVQLVASIQAQEKIYHSPKAVEARRINAAKLAKMAGDKAKSKILPSGPGSSEGPSVR